MSADGGGELHALLVGIDRYEPQRVPGHGLISGLQGSVRDAERMEAFLRDGPLAVPPERIRKLVSPASRPGRPRPAAEDLPSYRNIVHEIERLERCAHRGDQVLIHYSGHGASLPTTVPEKKGWTGRDEALVPCNAAKPREEGGGFLRDLELHALLRRLSDRGLRVTLVLDCCHSGGVTRGRERSRVRGLGRLPIPPEPPGPMGEWRELAAGLREPATDPRRPAFRGVEGVAGWFPQPEGCLLLAACLPGELAREYPFEDGRWSGALTHFLLEAVRDLGGRASYRRLHTLLLGRIRSLWKQQTPVVEGDWDVAFLGRERWPAEEGVRILETSADRHRVLLAAGRAQGLAAGARLEIPGGEEGSGRFGLEIVEAGATTSWARVDELPEGRRVAGSVATLVHPGPDVRRYRIGTFAPPGTGEGDLRALERLLRELAGRPSAILQPAGAGEEPDFVVEVVGGAYRIHDKTREALPHQGEAIAAGAFDAATRLTERLAHLAHYHSVAELANPDPRSSLKDRLRLELFSFERKEDRDHPELWARMGAAPISEGLCLALRVHNDSERNLGFVVLALHADWGICRVHPGRLEGDSTHLSAEAAHDVFLRTSLPEWMDEGRDRLLVLAATGPLDVSHLEREALGPSTGTLRGRDLPSSRGLRGRLLRSGNRGSVLRGAEPSGAEKDDWTVAGVELSVARSPARGSGYPSTTSTRTTFR
jgi:hypothetical protein